MQICTNMSWLRHYQGRLMLFILSFFFWGGGAGGGVTYIT